MPMSERAQYWARRVAAWEKSGLSQAEFCRRQDIKAVSFSWWKRQLRGVAKKVRRRASRGAGGPKSRKRSAFVEVALPKTALGVGSLSTPVFGVGSSGYEIALNCGRMIRLPRDFDPAVVAQLITMVESC